MSIDTIELTQDLIRCPSVTPISAGVMDVLGNALESLGFTVHRMVFSGDGGDDTENLYARLGDSAPNLCFAGHTDVVPAGDDAAWDTPPFDPTIKDGVLYGRGAEDMKGALAAFVSAVSRYVKTHDLAKGSLSFLITNDEEGPATNGTKKVLQWLQERGETIDHCIVGEPTNPDHLGEMIKVGRRGSITCQLIVNGKQGHIAYPHKADNPVTKLVDILHTMSHHTLDDGTDFFPPSNFEVTSVDVGNPTSNLIPGAASARFNVRFNDQHSCVSLEEWMDGVCRVYSDNFQLHCHHSGEAFLNKDERLSDLLVKACEEVTGLTPELSTTGGTSDARFIKDICPVIEFGTTGPTAHHVNECVKVETLEKLSTIYEHFLQGYFVGQE